MSAGSPVPSRSPHPASRAEWLTLFALIMLAASLRLGYPQRLAVEHFDEGVYASNIWFADRPDGVYPAQHLYAPPLLPALIEWGFVFLGPSNSGAMWPNQLAGVVTVMLMWWLGRSWFGPVAGMTAAALCAVNEVHLLLSRSGMTDALLGMWWLATLLALRRACDSGRWSHSLIAGLLVGLAWYTKYNGWMPLGITLGAVLSRGAFSREIGPQTRRALTSCLIAGTIAFAIWSPWLWSLQAKGGYSSVLANHRLYVVGFNGWLSSANRHWSQLSALTGFLTVVVLCGGYVAMTAAAARAAKLREANLDEPQNTSLANADSRSSDSRSSTPFWLVYFSWRGAFLWVLIGISFPVVSQFALTAQSLVLWWLWSRCPPSHRSTAGRDDLGCWMLTVWFVGLFAATPLYLPYLRLSLPWVLANLLGTGWAFQLAWHAVWVEHSPIRSARYLKQWSWIRVPLLLLIGGVVWGMTTFEQRGRWRPPKPLLPISDHSEFAVSCRQMAETVMGTAARSSPVGGNSQSPSPAVNSTPAVPSVVYVYGEPALLFQLRTAGVPIVGPVSSLQFVQARSAQATQPDVKVYLAFGIHAMSDPRFGEQFAEVRSQLRKVGRWPWHLGLLTALDQPQCEPTDLGHDPTEAGWIELYEVIQP